MYIYIGGGFLYKKYYIKRALIFILTVISLILSFNYIVQIIYYYGNNSTFNAIAESGLTLTYVMHLTCLLIPCIVYILTIIPKGEVKETLRFNSVSIQNIGYVTAITFLIYPFITLISYISGLFYENVSAEILSETLSMPFFLAMLSIGIMPAITEELVLRGVFLSNFKDDKNFFYAVLNGLFFGLLHGNLSQFFFAFFIGIVFYYLVKIGNSIFLAMYAHFLINGSQVTLMYLTLDETTIDTSTTDISDPLVAETILVLSVICIIFGLILFPVFKCFIKHNSYKKSVTNSDTNYIL